KDKIKMRWLQDPKNTYKVGMLCAVSCAAVWGFLPFYWKSLDPIPSSVIIFYRITLVALLMFFVNLKVYGWKRMKEPLKDKKALGVFFLAGVVISANWGIYIWAVNAGFVIQTSIGYYIDPLLICIFGVVFFREKLNSYKLAAFLLACAGVGVMVFSYGKLPLVALALALTFAVYTAIKKMLHAPALLALFYETVFLVPAALAVILYQEMKGQGALAFGQPYQWALLALIGLFTALPLSLFAMAANRISLVALGITEYISPSIALLLGIFVFREPFDLYQFIGFVIIWIGLAVFTVGSIRCPEENEMEERKQETPGDFRIVTGGAGGEVLLITGSEKTAVYDAGMAYCGPALVENIKKELEPLGRSLDYVLLSHTHYDHCGGVPYLRQAWPGLTVYGAAYGKAVLEKPGALETIRRLSQEAADVFAGGVLPPYSDSDMKIDRAVGTGDSISLGDRVFQVYNTPGHTNCCLSFFLKEEGILLASESSGLYSPQRGMHASILSGYGDALASIELCRSLNAGYIYSPHTLLVSEEIRKGYWDMAREVAEELKDFVLECREKGLSREETMAAGKVKYWDGSLEREQPLEAFMVNMEAKIRLIDREFPE
ncbi:MAG: EamA family transporter RarD, partial [Bacillota bacterium]|nr:EamA family transporter RarD [Bacillota bacterium]